MTKRLYRADFTALAAFAANEAHRLYNAAGLPPFMAEDDAHDVAVYAYTHQMAIMRGHYTSSARKGVLLRRVVSRLKDALARRIRHDGRTGCLGGVSVDAAPRGEYDGGGNENRIESALLNDGGAGARLIRSMGERTPVPEWRLMTRHVIRDIRKHGNDNAIRRVMNAMMRTLTNDNIARKARVTRRELTTKLKILKVRFAQCYQAYRAERRKFKRTFS